MDGLVGMASLDLDGTGRGAGILQCCHYDCYYLNEKQARNEIRNE